MHVLLRLYPHATPSATKHSPRRVWYLAHKAWGVGEQGAQERAPRLATSVRASYSPGPPPGPPRPAVRAARTRARRARSAWARPAALAQRWPPRPCARARCVAPCGTRASVSSSRAPPAAREHASRVSTACEGIQQGAAKQVFHDRPHGGTKDPEGAARQRKEPPPSLATHRKAYRRRWIRVVVFHRLSLQHTCGGAAPSRSACTASRSSDRRTPPSAQIAKG